MPKQPAAPLEVTIPNQVFIGCPWKTVRPKYNRIIDRLRKRSPLSFILVGREDGQEAQTLLVLIKNRMLESSLAIFDATGGNANVSLEYGFAEAKEIPRSIYFCTHGAGRRFSSRDSAIIADLAGARRKEYAQERALETLLLAASDDHAYTKRFESFLRRVRKEKKRVRALALKVIHALDGKRSVRRTDIVERLLADPVGYRRDEVDKMILRLHQQELVLSVQGPYATVAIR